MKKQGLSQWDDTSKQVIREEVNYGGIYTTLSYLNGLGSDHIILYGLPEYANDSITTNWYLAFESLTLSSRMQVTGTVNLVICDGVTITCNDGILCPSGSALNIYFQSAETGQLIAHADTNDNAAIGGDSEDAANTAQGAGIGGDYGRGNSAIIDGSSITIKGGTVSATGGSYGAGIGGGNNSCMSEITISGNAEITAVGGAYAAGIGGGEKGRSGKIRIDGGDITVKAADVSKSSSAGAWDKFAAEGNYYNLIGASHKDALYGVTGNVTFNGATVRMETKTDSNDVFSQARGSWVMLYGR